MEYGAAYLRPRNNSNDDADSILSGNRESQYIPYRPEHRRQSSDAAAPRVSWSTSPVANHSPLTNHSLLTNHSPSPSLSQAAALQQCLPPLQPPADTRQSVMSSSLFGSRAVLDSPYHETVAWERSTHFQSTRPASPKPELQPVITITPESESPREARRYFRHPRHIPEPWRSGFWLRFPSMGFSALFLILLLTGASAGVLLASDGSSPGDWKVGNDEAQPQVYVSIFEMMMNFLILFALVDGMAIRFWRQLLRGSTLSSIHDIYQSSNLWHALKRIFRLQFNVVATACLLASISSLRGPLFQRALTVREGYTSDISGSVGLKIAPYPIIEYFQSSDADPRKQGSITSAFASSIRNTSSGIPLLYEQPTECGEQCTGKVKGFAFNVSCTLSSRRLSLKNILEQCKGCFTKDCTNACRSRPTNELSPTFFSIGYETDPVPSSDAQTQTLTLTSVVKDQPSCEGDIRVQTCSLKQVAADYMIEIANGTIDRLSNDSSMTLHDDTMPLDKRLMEKYWPLAMEFMFPSVAVNVTPTEDFSTLQYLKYDKTGNNSDSLLVHDVSILYATPNQAPAGQDALCGLTWKDPMQDMINKLQSLAFRITVDMANSDGSVFAPSFTDNALSDLRKPWSQTINVTGTTSRTVYQTSRVLVAIGIILSLVGVIAMLPLYMGFWELGRKFSLNPLEIARAFGAPLMQGMDGNATPEMILVERGGMAVRYGALERFGDEKKLRIDEMARATVRMPWQGEIFG